MARTGFATGNIILGGDGSDIIEGRGGDDLIDGDKWLNVRISVRANIDGTGAEIASFDSMSRHDPADAGRDLQSRPAGRGSRNQGRPVGEAFDTAVFSGNLADYTVTINDNGTPGDFSDDIVTVTDNVARVAMAPTA